MLPCPFIAFASVRGGTGRTMAAAATARALRRRGLRPLLVDLDLEAPGLTHELEALFGPKRGFGDLAFDEMHGRRNRSTIESLRDCYHAVGGLGIMPAAKLSSASNTIWSLSDWLYERGAGELWMLRWKTEIVVSGLFDCVVLDLRAGYAKIVDRVVKDTADFLVVLSHPRDTHLHDTERFLEHAQDLRREVGRGPVPVLRALSMVPSEAPAHHFRKLVADHPGWVDLQVGYHPRLACANALTDRDEEKSIIEGTYADLTEGVWKTCWAPTPQRDAEGVLD